MIHVIAGLALGILFGGFSGLMPGFHPNMMAGLLIGFSTTLLPLLGPEGFACILLATLVTHTFLEIVPATFLGIPEDGTALAVLPAHSLTLLGKGEEAIRISALGSLMGIVFGIPLSVVAYFVLPGIQGLIDWWTGIILVFILGFFIVWSNSPGWSLFVFLISGLLGVFAFRYDYLVWNGLGSGAVLMPLLTGMFGIALLISSSHGKIPVQFYRGLDLSPGKVSSGVISGTLAGMLVGWLPGLSNATANGVIASIISYEQDGRHFLLASGAAAMSNTIIGLFALFAIGRMRNGVMVALSSIELPSLSLLLTALSLSSIVAYLLTISIAGRFSFFSGFDIRRLNLAVMIFLFALCAIFTGPFGLFILLLAIVVGLVPGIVQIPRVSCIGVVSIPVILYSFGLSGF